MSEPIGRGFSLIPHEGLVSATVVATTSGTLHDIPIPPWARKITVMLDNVSTNGVSVLILQIGDASGIETSGYLGTCLGLSDATAVSAVSFPNAFALTITMAGTTGIQGLGTLAMIDASTNTWVWHGCVGRNDATTSHVSHGAKSLSTPLDRVRLTTNGGVDVFDLGKFNLLYE